MSIEIKDYGFNAGVKVSEIFEAAKEEAAIQGKKLRVAAAINNNDYEELLSSLIKNDTNTVVKGMAIAGKEYNAEAGIVYLRAEDQELEKQIIEAGKSEGLEVTVEVIDIVDLHVKSTDEYVNAVCHFETYNAIATGKNTVLISTNVNGTKSELKEYSFGTKVSEILSDVDPDEVKMIYIGTKLYDKSGMDLEITEDFQPSNGVIRVLGKAVCSVDEAVKDLADLRSHSCGKCMFCREGGIQMHSIMKDFTAGKGKEADFNILKEISEAESYSTLCSVGKSGGDSVLGIFEYFGDEIEDHVTKKKCSADVCQSFMNIYIDPNKCTGCEECVEVCPVDCIEGDDGYIHMIDEMDCTKCGKCIEVCEDDAIKKATGRLPKLPKKLTKVGKFKR